MTVTSVSLAWLSAASLFIKMFKLAVVIALIGFVYANPVPQADAAANTAGFGQANSGFSYWRMPEFPNFNFKWPEIPTFSPETIASWTPAPGAFINAVSSSINSHTEMVDGKPVIKTEGHYTINKNGVIETGSFPVESDNPSTSK